MPLLSAVGKSSPSQGPAPVPLELVIADVPLASSSGTVLAGLAAPDMPPEFWKQYFVPGLARPFVFAHARPKGVARQPCSVSASLPARETVLAGLAAPDLPPRVLLETVLACRV